ncbi:hypothetical protein BU15DRAFT_87620 [Melanogaster broomeanus]|nr:hypothetical protein BU15DRAFT_87620 [Melanogaster broomeanus]
MTADGEHASLLENDEMLVDKEVFRTPRVVDGRLKPWTSQWLESKWVVALLFAVWLTDVGGFFYVYRTFQNVYADDGAAANLEVGDPYIGLDRLYRSGAVNSSKIEAFINAPRVAAPVTRSRPQDPPPRGKEVAIYPHGTLAPNEKHLRVDSDTNTILQFRTIDFGMEKCELVIGLPWGDEELEGNATFGFQDLSAFDVYRLDHPGSVDVRKLSWRSRPQRQHIVGTVTPAAGQETTISSVACHDDSDCLVDVWTSHNKTWGVYMYQHQTI